MMAEPEAQHPFSSHFRSQLANVLSRPHHPKKPIDEKQYLETEIDSYSGVEFDNATKTSRPPTPPRPNRTFTFDQTNPFALKTDVAALSLPRYAEVVKPKSRPKIPPKPMLRSNVKNTNTLPNARNLPDEQTTITKEDYFLRVNSLPNLLPPKGHSDSSSGYGELNRIKNSLEPKHASALNTATDDKEYCDVLPEVPSYSEKNASQRRTTIYDDVYEDVDSEQNVSNKLSPSESAGSDSDYTLMRSPLSEMNFTFGSKPIYENTDVIHSPVSDVFYPNEYENVNSPKFPLGDPNRVGLPDHTGFHIPPKTSPTSSYDDQDSSAYSVQSSMASTTASSFQKVQVCYFPPSPPSEFRDRSSTMERPASVASGGSKRSSSSRSRIPVPIKPKQDPAGLPMTGEQLPPTPSPSPARTKKNSKNTKDLKMSPPIAADDAVEPIPGKGAKGAKWYEKLGCIQTDTIKPSEPYGLPGERKRSKSLNREQRKSQFFLPVEPNESSPPVHSSPSPPN